MTRLKFGMYGIGRMAPSSPTAKWSWQSQVSGLHVVIGRTSLAAVRSAIVAAGIAAVGSTGGTQTRSSEAGLGTERRSRCARDVIDTRDSRPGLSWSAD